MKKTLIALMAMAGVAMAYTDSATKADHTLSSTETYDDYRVLVAGSNKTGGNEDGSVSITVNGPVTISAINGSGLDKVNSVTYNIEGAFTVTTAELKPTTNGQCSQTLNLGTTGSFNSLSDKSLAFGTYKTLTFNVGMVDAETAHVFVTTDFLNVNLLDSEVVTFNVTAPAGYKDGGLVFYYANSGTYYAASDIVKDSTGNYFKLKDGATTIELYNDSVYTIASMTAYDNQIASVKSLSLAAGTVSIPEPATATLSLLALAGLAARRRRH